MPTVKFIFFLLIVTIASACSNSDADKREKELLQKELEQKNKELELKNKETELLKQQDSLKNIQLNNKDYNLADIYSRVKNSVFLIFTTDDITISQGSAFIINSNGDAISNFHVFENASKAIAMNSEGRKFIIDKIYKYNRENDYIIFRIGPNFKDFNPVPIAQDVPRTGDACFAIGNPEGLTQTLSTGIVSSYRDNNRLIQTTAEITHGSSGGALFNKNGEVIGITTSGYGQANLNFAINIKTLPLDNYLNPSLATESNGVISLLETENIKNQIKGYFNAVLLQDYERVLNYYIPTLDRFYDQFNVSGAEAINNDYNYKKTRGIIPKEINVDWESFTAIKNADGFSASFQLFYSITRDNMNKPTSFNLRIFVEFSQGFKIKSIYEDILSKY